MAGAWLAGLFIEIGLHAADAYAFMVACWLSVAFYGAYRLARFMGASPRFSILAALSWGTMPMVWNHAAYSMLSLGIALLPFYFWMAARLFSPSSLHLLAHSAIYLTACLIAIFMDGYSFMMFAIGSSIFGFFMVVTKKSSSIRFILHSICFTLAYLIFALYIGKGQYEAADLDFFRGWGADISFFLIPSAGVHWFADLIGWSTPRSMDEYFGDTSVWITTFCLPLVLGASIITFFAKSKYKYSFLIIAFFGFYMALGPSFKFNSTKPTPETSDLMEAQYAIGPTGSAFLSETLPGFKNMRASYRWGALGFFGTWALIVLALSRQQRKAVTMAAATALVIISALNLPDLEESLDAYRSNRSQFMEIDHDLLSGMGKLLKPGEKVAFLPWRNDFLANYLAAKMNIIAYNVGGDKNYQEAKKYWPAVLKELPMGSSQRDFSARVVHLLMQKDADAIVLPYIDMLWAAHQWPSPETGREAMTPKILELRNSGYVDIVEDNYYSVVRLKSEFFSSESPIKIIQEIEDKYCLAQNCVRDSKFSQGTLTQVGKIVDGSLVATGKPGFLHFGPYTALHAGDYMLSVHGSAENAGAAWVDVVSGKGSVNHGKFMLEESVNVQKNLLIQTPIHLPHRVDDLEIRVYVDADAEISLDGYDLLPVTGETHQ
ncbi:hypothetical protein GCM10027082_33230 [Comamonas humi]